MSRGHHPKHPVGGGNGMEKLTQARPLGDVLT